MLVNCAGVKAESAVTFGIPEAAKTAFVGAKKVNTPVRLFNVSRIAAPARLIAESRIEKLAASARIVSRSDACRAPSPWPR